MILKNTTNMISTHQGTHLPLKLVSWLLLLSLPKGNQDLITYSIIFSFRYQL